MKFLLVACFALLSVASGHPIVSQWTLNELSAAIQSPETNPIMVPYLVNALNDMMISLFHGVEQPFATVVIPSHVAEAMNPDIVTPVIVQPVIVEPVQPEVVAPVKPVEQSQSPLVQIILNINQGSAPVAETPVTPVTLPEVVETPIAPEQVDVAILPEVVDVAILPEAVDVAILPETVQVANPVNPIDQVAIEALPPMNPIDQVAIEALPVNPVDIIAPIGVVAPSTDGIHV